MPARVAGIYAEKTAAVRGFPDKPKSNLKKITGRSKKPGRKETKINCSKK